MENWVSLKFISDRQKIAPKLNINFLQLTHGSRINVNISKRKKVDVKKKTKHFASHLFDDQIMCIIYMILIGQFFGT